MEDVPRFVSLDLFTVGEAALLRAELDRDCSDFSHLIGRPIEIDGVRVECDSIVEYEGPPHLKGALITLMIKRRTAANDA
jgi:hypothetical protein